MVSFGWGLLCPVTSPKGELIRSTIALYNSNAQVAQGAFV